MNFTTLFWTICATYSLGWFICCFYFFQDKRTSYRWGDRFLFLGLAIQLFYIVSSYIELDSFMFDSLSGLFLFLSLLLIIVFFILDFYFPNLVFQIIFPPLTLFFLILSFAISDLVIVSQTFLSKSPIFGRFILYLHASCSMLGYLLFGIACVMSIFFLYQEWKIKSKTVLLQKVRVPSLGLLDSVNYKMIKAGFLFLTVGLLLGINMKIISTGGRASISLRQVLPLFPWVIYAIFLVDRFFYGIRGKITAVWAIAGFSTAATSFAYEVFYLIQKH